MKGMPKYYVENCQVFERSGSTAACIAIGNNDEVAQMIAAALNEQTTDGRSKLSSMILATRTLVGDMRRQADRADRICDVAEKGAKPNA